jgi:3',5'-cyclic AMP phosphodiesterase CpdA
MKRIAHLSDLHFGAESEEIADAAAEDVRDARVDLVAVSGDLTQRARRSQFQAAADFLARLPGPRIVVPGNHDVPLINVVLRLTDPFDRYCDLFGDDLSPFWTDGELAVLGISTVRPLRWKEGRITAAQRERILSTFAGSTAFKVVVMHHPVVPPENDGTIRTLRGAREAVQVFHEAAVDLVLSGHIHLASRRPSDATYRVDRRSTLVVQAGTATSRRTRDEANNWNLIEIDGDRIRVRVRTWNGVAFTCTTYEEFSRFDRRWVRDLVLAADRPA